jgi:hypothetical protein
VDTWRFFLLKQTNQQFVKIQDYRTDTRSTPGTAATLSLMELCRCLSGTGTGGRNRAKQQLEEVVMHLGHDIICFFFAWGLIVAGPVSAEESSSKERVVPELRAMRVNPHAPVVDGRLDDSVWKNSKIDFVSEFIQREPDEGKAATESTLVAIVYDESAIYVAFRCYDSEPDKIARQLVRRDRYSESDAVTVRLDPYHDHQTGYSFEVSASGVQRDWRLYNDDNSDGAWNGVWESSVKHQPWGWSAEMKIPYHCLRFTEKQDHVWGVSFARSINRKSENSWWSYVPSSEGGFVSTFGHLTGLRDIEPARHLELLPYVVSNMETEPKQVGNPDGRNFFGNSGLDIKYGLSSNLTLDATINPDFGQVELDDPVLNLSVFETYFSERRPFFLEGSDLYISEFNLFYSRRIGRAPRGDVDDEGIDYYSDYPKASTILGAAKISGKLPGGTSVAFLAALTDEEKAEYATTSGDTRKGVVEPRAGYSVLRIKQDVLSRSSVGGMLTLASQDTRHPAVTGGVDWNLYTNNGVWRAHGQTVFSRVDPENIGYGVDLTFEKAAGEHVRGSTGIHFRDPHLNLNHIGFLDRNDYRHAWSWLQYRTSDDWWIIRDSWNNFNFYAAWNYDGDNIQKGGNFNTYIVFTNNWSLGGGSGIQGEKYSDLETRGHGLWQWPVYPTFSWWLSLNTDTRKMVSFNLNPGGGSDRGGSWWANYVGLELRPKSNMEFSFGVNVHRTFNGTRWVENPDDTTTVFADLDQDRVTLHASAGVVFHRNLSCQLSAEGLISGLDYQNYRPYLGGNNYGSPLDENENEINKDYNYSALNSTLLIRWEYNPGSTIYLVWTRSRSQSDDRVNDLDFSRDFDRFFSAGSENIFLIKASYWMNM